MSRRLTAACACLALVPGGALLAGCGSSNSKSSGSSTPAAAPTATTPKTPAAKPAATTPKPSATASGATVQVTMKNIQFVPQSITVKVGQKIHWTNDDSFAHTVTATSGAKFDSGTVNGGGTFDFTPTTAGTINYVCLIHSSQTGTITVTG